LQAQATRPAPRRKEPLRDPRRNGPTLRQAEARRAKLEAEIERLEERLAVLSRELELASKAQQVNRLYDLGQEYARVEQQLQQHLDEWSGVSEACPSRTSSA
jgi:gamma-glutamyl:cysteine ligase YbdK (ATP-grasp superfamily)